MSAPRSGVSDESMVNVDEGPKSVGWHDHHGMELTHVREFEPRYARGAPLGPVPATSRCQPYEHRNGTAEILSHTKPETRNAFGARYSRFPRGALTFLPPHSEPSDSDDELRSPRGRGDAVTGCCVIQ
jgi:hypothetical protein